MTHPTHDQIIVDNVAYDTSHLNPFDMIAPFNGRNEKPVTIRVGFSCHVYTEQCTEGAGHIRDHHNNPRNFAFRRYELTQSLPHLISTGIQGNHFAYTVKDKNQWANLALFDLGGGLSYRVVSVSYTHLTLPTINSV